MSNIAFFFQLLLRLGPKALQAWPHIQAIIALLQDAPASFAADSAQADAPSREDFVSACCAAGVSKAEANAAADKLDR